ncbi:MAG TPA: SRPBCC domain-containing protein [Nocardioides sp.]|uniref:SRPBCC domain-containing protein n=1 Tax=Nocardioides sp. TaxID=35761 RepID=UPI002E2ECDBA|nr:SRPBCC domain-containing protein [Nocardioides sp.]HEX3930752.1 SRPBCC domain-containing protein [Nocardioides sp.]
MTTHPNRSVMEFPHDLEIVHKRDFEAPIGLVFDVFTQEEHVRQTFAPFDETVTVCEIDLRVGGAYHFVFVTPDGVECSFRGTYLELDPPTRLVATWHFDGWPDADAVETVELSEVDGRTALSYRLRFTDQTGRNRMTKYDGLESNFDNIADYLGTLTAQA